MSTLDISIVIPCLNEVGTIGKTLSALVRELNIAALRYEIIVVDNGSTDGSDLVAKEHGVTFIQTDVYPVAAVRNLGVKESQGTVLVFLDADIVVQDGWGLHLGDVCKRLMEDDNLITGSHPQVPDDIRPALYHWYKSLSEDTRDTHMGTGHMIVSRATFERVGGFDESLVTNEDFYFCIEAKKMGVAVVSHPDMKVFHLGYPNNYSDFLKREIWHGLGDCNTIGRLLRSRVVWFGVAFIAFGLLAITSLFFSPILFFISLFAFLLLPAGFNIIKFGYGGLREFTYRSLVACVYLFSRGLAIPIYILNKNKRLHRGHKLD